jgi:phenylacetate-CoA ligase
VFPSTVPEAATYFASLIRFSWEWRSRRNLDLGVTARVSAGTSTHATSAMTQLFPPQNEMHMFPITSPLPAILDGLNRVQPTTLVGYPSALSLLAGEQIAGRLQIAPTHLTATSETLTQEARALTVRAWGVEPENMFGSTEGLMGWAAPGDDTLTFNDDNVIVEPVDAQGRPVGPGESAQRLLITNLFNHTLPLIRYELTDELTVAPRGEQPFFRATKIEGRADDVFRYGAIAVHPLVFRSPLGRCPNVTEYQVRQTARGAEISLIADHHTNIATTELAATLTAALRTAGVDDPQVSVAVVPELERHPVTGKLRRFIPS